MADIERHIAERAEHASKQRKSREMIHRRGIIFESHLLDPLRPCAVAWLDAMRDLDRAARANDDAAALAAMRGAGVAFHRMQSVVDSWHTEMTAWLEEAKPFGAVNLLDSAGEEIKSLGWWALAYDYEGLEPGVGPVRMVGRMSRHSLDYADAVAAIFLLKCVADGHHGEELRPLLAGDGLSRLAGLAWAAAAVVAPPCFDHEEPLAYPINETEAHAIGAILSLGRTISRGERRDLTEACTALRTAATLAAGVDPDFDQCQTPAVSPAKALGAAPADLASPASEPSKSRAEVRRQLTGRFAKLFDVFWPEGEEKPRGWMTCEQVLTGTDWERKQLSNLVNKLCVELTPAHSGWEAKGNSERGEGLRYGIHPKGEVVS